MGERFVRKATLERDGTITHEMSDGERKRYAAIRGGIAWATASAPAFYCIFGAEYVPGTRYQDQPKPEGKLVLLSEYQAKSLVSQSDFIRRLTDDAKRYWCSGCYASGVEGLEPEPAAELFRKSIDEMKLTEPHISLHQAPWSEDFKVGFGLIGEFKEKRRLQILSDSAVYQQATVIGEAELKDSPENRFNAVNALRYVLASFKKQPPSTGSGYQPRRSGRAQKF